MLQKCEQTGELGVEQQYLHIVDSEYKAHGVMNDEDFAICPREFYAGLTEHEVTAMQQIYKVAYEKARQKIQRKESGFFDGDGI